MTVEHSNITDPYLHQPKGYAAASAGQFLKKNNAGTDIEWVTRNKVFGCISANSGTTTGVSSSWLPVNDASIGGSIVWNTNQAEGISVDTTGGYYEALESGIYMVNIAISISGAISAANEFQFTIGIDSSPYGATAEQSTVATSYRTITSSDKGSVSLTCMPTLTVGDRLYILVQRNSGTNQIVFDHINHVIVKASV